MSKLVIVVLLVAAGVTGWLYSFRGEPARHPSPSSPRSASSAPLALAEEEKAATTPAPADTKKEAQPTEPTEPTEPPAPTATDTKKKYPAQDPSQGALEGKITFEGELPVFKLPEIRADHPEKTACVDHLENETLILSENNEIKDVVVSVAKYKPENRVKPRTITLDNKHCAFVPHVQAATVRSKLKITNSDLFLHNTRAVLAASFNQAVAPGREVEKALRKPGWIPVGCDLHPWMRAHIWIFAHDLFDVSEADGAYKIPNIPPGEYDIEYWHEYPLKRQTKKVTIEAGKTTRLDVAFRKQEKKK